MNRTTDWESFRNDLQKKINLKIILKTTELLEEAERFVNLIQEVTTNNTKEITHTTKGINYPLEVRLLIKDKIKARRRWQQPRDPSDKTTLNNKFQYFKREIKS